MPYVLPEASPAVLDGDDLENAFQETMVGVSGLPDGLVRPRWQPEPSNMPDAGADWLAFGITAMPPDTYAYLRQVDDLTCEMNCGEELRMLCSFYGPNAQRYAGVFRDGLRIDSNRADLAVLNIKLISTGEQRQVPSLQKQLWIKRVDVPATWRRWVVRRYKVAAIASLAGSFIDNEFYKTPITLNPPPP